jgi:hypothetical protein
MFQKLRELFVQDQQPTVEDFDELLRLRGSSLQAEMNVVLKRADDLRLKAEIIETEAEDQQARILSEFEEQRKKIILERDRKLKLVEADQIMARGLRQNVRVITGVLSKFSK